MVRPPFTCYIIKEDLPDFGTCLESYRRHGDLNPLHYPDIKASAPLSNLLGDSSIRVVPAGIIAQKLYDQFSKLQTPHANPYAFTFQHPTFFTYSDGEYKILTTDDSTHRKGRVLVTPLSDPPKQAFTMPQMPLYDALGLLWKNGGDAVLAQGKVPIITSISIGAPLPGDMIPKIDGFYVNSLSGGLAAKVINYQSFVRLLGSNFAANELVHRA